MISERLMNWIRICTVIGCKLGASSYRPDPKHPYKLSVDEIAVKSVEKSFIMAVVWGIGGFFIVVKYYKEGNKDQLHLAMSWWLGYILILLVYSIHRLLCREVCIVYNSLFDFLLKVKGKKES